MCFETEGFSCVSFGLLFLFSPVQPMAREKLYEYTIMNRPQHNVSERAPKKLAAEPHSFALSSRLRIASSFDSIATRRSSTSAAVAGSTTSPCSSGLP